MFDTVLDNFTGGDENPIATNWSGPIRSGDSQLERLSNKLAHTAGSSGGSYYDITTFGPDVEAFITLDTLNVEDGSAHSHLIVRGNGFGTSSPTGYSVYIFRNAGASNDWLTAARWNGTGSYVDLGASVNIGDWVAGEKIGIRVIGNTITGWRYTGGSWSEILSRTDSTYAASGSVGLWDQTDSGARWDDFGAATVSPLDMNIRIVQSSLRW